MAALRFAVLCASAGLGCAYVLWKFRRKKGEASPFRFDAPLRPDVKLPDGPVESGATVELTDEYRKQKMRHLVMSGAISSEYLEKLQPIIKDIFVPQKVIYNGGVEWANSCYMDVEQKMKPATMPHLAMATACEPVLAECDRLFKDWYTSHHGKGSVETLTRLQSFVTRYRPIAGENQLARHVDGRNVHGSIILGLPTDDPFQGGGVTVWDGSPQTSPYYPMLPGDICFLDRCVWHQGNPITAGTRWVIVIFYAVAGSSLSRADSRARGVHTVNAKSLLQSANWIQETGKHGMQLQGGAKFEQSLQKVVAHPLDVDTRASLERTRKEEEERKQEAAAKRGKAGAEEEEKKAAAKGGKAAGEQGGGAEEKKAAAKRGKAGADVTEEARTRISSEKENSPLLQKLKAS